MGYLIAFILLVVAGGLGVGLFLQRRRMLDLEDEAEARSREREAVVRFLDEFGSRLTHRIDLGEVLELIVQFCREVTHADAGALFLREPDDRNLLRARVVQGLFPPLHGTISEKMLSRHKFIAELVKKETTRIGEGIIGEVAVKGESILVPDAKADPRLVNVVSGPLPLEGMILAPLVVRGNVEGVLVLVNKRDEDEPGATFTPQERDLVRALGDQAAVTLDIVRLNEELAEKQRLEQELAVARDVQQLLLPREMPTLPEVAIAGISQPALEVGGDYFDFIEVDADHLGIVVADVAGKGIPGALVMATMRAALRAHAPGKLSPREVLVAVNTVLVRDTKDSTFVSATYGVLDRRNGVLRFARAGHEPTVCVAANEARVEMLDPDGMVLGMIEGECFDRIVEQEVDLKTAGAVLLYTDGVSEAMNGTGEEYGLDRFAEVLKGCRQAMPRTMIDTVLDDIRHFTAGIAQHDDITLVVLRWNASVGSGTTAPAERMAQPTFA